MSTASSTEQLERSGIADPESLPRWRYGCSPWLNECDTPAGIKPRTRVIIDNDFAGDPDDLFQLAHHLLIEGTQVCGVVVSRLREDDGWNLTGDSIEAGRAKVKALLDVMGADDVALYSGDNRGFKEFPDPTAASQFIVEEAMRDDDRPLYLVAGGSLGDVARAYRAEPQIADRLTLIWIGGSEHPGLAYIPDGATPLEYNMALDVEAACYVFNDTDARIWQIPRNVYRSSLVPLSVIRAHCQSSGSLGQFLLTHLRQVQTMLAAAGMHTGATYVLGDQPLVLLSSLHTTFEPDTASSAYDIIPRVALAPDGTYRYPQHTRPMRRYTQIDNHSLFADMFATFEAFAQWHES